jgi:hypothetical protein
LDALLEIGKTRWTALWIDLGRKDEGGTGGSTHKDRDKKPREDEKKRRESYDDAPRKKAKGDRRKRRKTPPMSPSPRRTKMARRSPRLDKEKARSDNSCIYCP